MMLDAIDAGANVPAWMVYACAMCAAGGVLWFLFWINWG